MRLVLFPLILFGGLWAPGWLLGRVLRVSGGAAGSFLGSALVLFHVVLGLDLLGLPLNFPHVAGGLLVASLLLWLAGRGRPHSCPPAPAEPSRAGPRWLFALVAVSLLAIAVKVGFEPLSGADNGFRWDRLAHQMMETARLNFYPPVSDDDFVLYGWCDGIAPLVSDLYLWAYLSLGKTLSHATTPIVLAEALLLFLVVYQLAARRAGPSAGLAAVLLLGGSPILLWGVAMGQETGLTALSLVAMLLFLERHRASGESGWLVWAGLAAGAGALSREYGLVYGLLGWIALAHDGRFRRGVWTFTLALALVTLPWFARNWVRTGNPLFSHNLAGLFPVNPAHRAVMGTVTDATRYWERPAELQTLIFALLLMTSATLGPGLIRGFTRWRETAPWTIAVLTIGGLWWWSMRQTAGGVIYALRVLTPALAVAAVIGGLAVGRWLETDRKRRWILLLLIPLTLDAGMRSLYLPFDHLAAWWRNPPGAWRGFGAELKTPPPAAWQEIARAAGADGILVLDPGKQLELADLGARALPVFSPGVLVIGDARRDFHDVLTVLREQHIRFVVDSKDDFIADRFVARARFLRELRLIATPQPIDATHVLFDLNSPALDSPHVNGGGARATPGTKSNLP